MPSAKTLRVYANPYQHLDHEGRPANACPCDPDNHTPDRRFVGATIKATKTEEADPKLGKEARYDRFFEFTEEKVEIPNTDYYRRAIKSGQLIAADEETAKLCGFYKGEYLDPKAVLETEKKEALKRFRAERGEDPPCFPGEQIKAWDDADAKAKADAEKAEKAAKKAAAKAGE